MYSYKYTFPYPCFALDYSIYFVWLVIVHIHYVN